MMSDGQILDNVVFLTHYYLRKKRNYGDELLGFDIQGKICNITKL